MKSILAISTGKVALADLPIPEIGPYEALVRVEACGICNGTDTKLIDGEFHVGPYPSAIGHESAGRVVALGDRVRGFRVGDRVLRPILYDSHVPGGRSTWGGMSEYGVVIDAMAVAEDRADVKVSGFARAQQVVPPSVTPVQAAAMITMKETLHFVKAFGVGGGRPVAIVGTGPVGQAFCFYAKLAGASPVVVFGRHLSHAGRFEALGADAYVVGDDYPASVRRLIASGGFGKAIEAVGSREALKRCLDVVGESGQVRVYGIAPSTHAWDEKDLRDPRVQQVGAREEEVHDEMLRMIAARQINLDDWVSHVLPVADYEEAFRMVRSKEASKVVLVMRRPSRSNRERDERSRDEG